MAEDNFFTQHQNEIASKSLDFLFLVLKMVKKYNSKKSKVYGDNTVS